MKHTKASDDALYRAVRNMATSCTTAFQDRLDVAHDAMLYVLEHDYNDQQHRDATAILKTRNLAIDINRAKAIPTEGEALINAIDRLQARDMPFGLYQQELAVYANEVRAKLDDLRPAQRDALVLHAAQEMKLTEVAAERGETLSVSKNLVWRGRREIARLCDDAVPS